MSVVHAIVCSLYMAPIIVEEFENEFSFGETFIFLLPAFIVFFFVIICIILLIVKKLSTKKEVIKKVFDK